MFISLRVQQSKPIKLRKFFSVHTQNQQFKPVTLPYLLEKYAKNSPLTMLTAHDYSSGLACDQSLIDMILVGDSLAQTALGHPNTLQITMSEMIHHAKAVKRGVFRSFLIGDMPFGTYFTPYLALQNAEQFIRAEMNAVKLEGGRNMVPIVEELVKFGFVVMGHIGLTPQSMNAFGGFKVFGAKEIFEAINLWEDAKRLRDAGASFIVLECVPDRLAALISKNLGIPTIGIGSGNGCNGQVLVFNDLIGVFDKKTLKFCKKFADLNGIVLNACKDYREEVEKRVFPVKGIHTFIIKDKVLNEISQIVKNDIEVKGGTFFGIDKKIDQKYDIKPIKNIVILGAGAIGSLFASKLSKNKEFNVRLIESRIQNNNPDVYNINVNKQEKYQIKGLNHSEIEKEWGQNIDLLVVCCKNYGTEVALDNLFTSLSPSIIIKNVISLQNGYNNVNIIENNLKKHKQNISNIFQFSVYSGVKVVATDCDNEISIIQAVSSKIDVALPKILQNSELEKIFKSDDFHIKDYINFTTFNGKTLMIDWEKLIVNSIINPLTALFNQDNIIISQSSHLQSISKLLIKECVNIMRYIPGSIQTIQKDSQKPIEEILFEKVLNVSQATATNVSSMRNDIIKGIKETEIDSFNGGFIDLAKKIGLNEEAYCVNLTILDLINTLSNLNKKS